MAKSTKKNGSAKLLPPGAIPSQIVMDVIPDVPTYYISHAEISMTQHDIGMSVGRLPPKLAPEAVETLKKTQVLHIEPMLQLLFAPTFLPGLIRALTIQRQQYENMFGPIHDPNPTKKEETK